MSGVSATLSMAQKVGPLLGRRSLLQRCVSKRHPERSGPYANEKLTAVQLNDTAYGLTRRYAEQEGASGKREEQLTS